MRTPIAECYLADVRGPTRSVLHHSAQLVDRQLLPETAHLAPADATTCPAASPTALAAALAATPFATALAAALTSALTAALIAALAAALTTALARTHTATLATSCATPATAVYTMRQPPRAVHDLTRIGMQHMGMGAQQPVQLHRLLANSALLRVVVLPGRQRL
jgi:hypothetical protein